MFVSLPGEVTYLGYLINESGVRPSREGVGSVLSYSVPRTIKEVHRLWALRVIFDVLFPGSPS